MNINTLDVDFSRYREPLQKFKTFAAQFSSYINAYPNIKGLSDLLRGYSEDLVYLDVELITFLNSILTIKTSSLEALLTMLDKNPTAAAIKSQVNIDFNKIVSTISNISLKLEYELLQIDSVALHNVAITLKSSLQITWSKLHELSDELHHLTEEAREELKILNEAIKLESEKIKLSQVLLDTLIPLDEVDGFINTVKDIPYKETKAPSPTSSTNQKPNPVTDPVVNPNTGPSSGTGTGPSSGTGIEITSPQKPPKKNTSAVSGYTTSNDEISEEFEFVGEE